VGLDSHRLADSFVEAGRLALGASAADRAAARARALRFERAAQVAPAVDELVELVRRDEPASPIGAHR
jgi:hypothetical protein